MPLNKLCICTIANIILVSFILVVSFYLIRRFYGINLNNIETFRVAGGICKPVIRNQINMNALARPLNTIAQSLQNIDNKLDFINGFKTIKEGKGKYDKTAKVPRSHYPDKRNDYKYAR